jgi:hypothetical protein
MAISLISSTEAVALTRDSVATVSSAIAVATSDIVVCKIISEDSGSVPTAVTDVGTQLTWTQRATTGAVASREYAMIYTATVSAGVTSIQTSFGTSNNPNCRASITNVWRGAQLAATPATNSTVSGATAPSATVTTVANNSVVDWICGDWDGANTTAAYRSSATEEFRRLIATIMQYEGAHQTAAVAGAQTIGMTTPATQKWCMVGIEVQEAPVVVGGSPDQRRRRLRPLLVR